MTNKEMAVQLYSAYLQVQATIFSIPNYAKPIAIPGFKEMVDEVEKLTDLLAAVKDE